MFIMLHKLFVGTLWSLLFNVTHSLCYVAELETERHTLGIFEVEVNCINFNHKEISMCL